MKSKRYLRSLGSWHVAPTQSERGFSLLELLVASGLGFAMLTLSMGAISANRRIYKQDIARTRIAQNLRGAMDVLSQDIREAGENLPPNFPAVEIINGASGAPDELIVRRSVLDETLKLCGSVSATTIPVAANPAPAPGCGRNDPDSSFSAWQTYFSAHGQFDVYLYDFTHQRGEFFRANSIQDTGTQRRLIATDSSWNNSYGLDSLGGSFVSNSAIYVLEEWRYRIRNGNLELIINEDNANPLIVSFDVSDFQASALLESGELKTDFTKADSWLELKYIDVIMTARGSFAGKTRQDTLESKFFPRNILSH